MGMSKMLRVLQIEDSAIDAALICHALESAGHDVSAERVETAAQMRAALDAGAWDVIVADYRLPQFDAPAALDVLHETGRDVPFIVVSGTIGEETAIAMMKSGVDDCVMKDHLVRLAPVVEREIREAKARAEHRAAQRAMCASEEKFRSYIEKAPVAVLVADAGGRFVDCNRAAEELLGYDTAALLQMNVLDIHPCEDRGAVLRQLARLAGEGHVQGEFRLQRSDGRMIWASINATTIGQGRSLAYCVDVTEVRRAADALRESEAKLNCVVESAMDAVMMIDGAGRIVLWNAAAERIFGYAPAEALGRELHTLVVPDRLTDLAATGIAQFSATGAGRVIGQTLEAIARRKDGSEFPIELSVTSARIGDQWQAVGVVRDITGRKKAEASLRESEQRWQFALEGAGDGVWDRDCTTNTIHFSRQWKAILGYDEEEIGTTLDEWDSRIHPDDRARVREEVRRHFEGRSAIYICEYRMRCKDGAYKWVLGRGRAICRTPEGAPLRVIGTITDVTDRKKGEEERERLQAQFLQAQKMESVGRLAGGVAHDFNNLLTIMNGYAGLVLSELSEDHPLRDSLEEIQNAGERATALVRQLLAFSRKQVLRPEVLDLNEVIAEMQRLSRRLVGEDIEIITRLSPDLRAVEADRHQIEQVILNLIVNARDAMPRGGRLTIETAEVWQEGMCGLCQSVIHPGHYAEVLVRDTGIGMDSETLKHIFEPFYTTKELGKGTGLGLATVQGIIVQSGGHLAIESQPGAGTGFRLYLPVIDRKPLRAAGEQEVSARGTETLLLVEDQAQVARVAARLLESYGYKVVSAASAEESLGVLTRQPVDLLLTDIVMPGMSGRELACRAREIRPGIKVLYMSGYAEEMVAPDPASGGVENFIQKPLKGKPLAEKVRSVLDASPSARILVVDDESSVRKFLRAVLEKAGHRVDEASDGALALRYLAKSKVDLVITDLVMPEKEGIEMIQVLRREHPSVPVIAISGAGGGAYLHIARALGAAAVLSKPLDGDALLHEVAQALRKAC